MTPKTILKIVNKNPESGYKSDYEAVLISEKEGIRRVLCTFGLSQTDKKQDQSLYVAKAINYVTPLSDPLHYEIEDDIDLSTILDCVSLAGYLKSGITFDVFKYSLAKVKVK